LVAALNPYPIQHQGMGRSREYNGQTRSGKKRVHTLIYRVKTRERSEGDSTLITEALAKKWLVRDKKKRVENFALRIHRGETNTGEKNGGALILGLGKVHHRKRFQLGKLGKRRSKIAFSTLCHNEGAGEGGIL